MDSVGAYQAKTHFSELLERVARGETVTITRHGVPVAVLAPPQRGRMTPQQAAEGIRELREKLRARGVSVSAHEIKEMIKEGRRQ